MKTNRIIDLKHGDNMKKYLDIRGCSVMNSEGNLEGIIEDCIFDIEKKKIYSCVVVKKGIIQKTFLLTLRNIMEYGDIIIFRDETHILKGHAFKRYHMMMLHGLIGKEIVKSDGKRVGNLSDIIFDEETGYIKALVCTRGIFEDITEGRPVIIVDGNTFLGGEHIIVGKDSLNVMNQISLKKFMNI
jgi:uncharacterized protein YrrD